MLVLILLTRNGERFSPSGGVIDREACWNGSEPRCWQPRHGVQFRPGKRRNKNNTGGFPWNHWFMHTGCLFLPFISVHPPLLLLLLCSSLSRRLPLRQHDFRSGPDRCRISGSRARRTTASLPESVHTQFPRSVLNLLGLSSESESRKHRSALLARRRPRNAVKRFAVENVHEALKKCHKLTFIHVIDSSLILIVCGNTKEYAEPCQTASSRDGLMEGRPAAFS